MAVKRLFLLAMLVACSARAADFGDIPASLAIPASQSVRRNAGNTAFEAYTPGSGGSSTFIGLDFTGSTMTFVNASGMLDDPLSLQNLAIGFGAGVNIITSGGITGALNTAIGYSALPDNTTGYNNTAIGGSAGQNIDTGHENVHIGTASGVQNDPSLTVGIGEGATTGGDGAIAIGYNTKARGQNTIVIGESLDVSTANTVSIGVNTVTDAYFGTGNAILHGNLDQIPNLTDDGFVTTSGGDGTLGIKAIVGGFTAHFSRGGAAIQTNDVLLTPWTCPYSGTITDWTISVNTGTCTLKVWKKANGTAIPTIADVINTSGVSIASGTHTPRGNSLSDFTTTTVTAGDMFIAQVTATSGPTDITFQVEITR